MNSKEKVKILLEAMKNIATTIESSDKELSFCKELYNEVRILCLREIPEGETQERLFKSGITMSNKDAIFALKIRIANLINSTL